MTAFDKGAAAADEAVVREVGKALFAGAEAIAVEAQISITRGSASGEKTKKHMHVPSRPGEPPNNFKGTLANNIEAALIEPLKAEVSSNATHSVPLEYGTSKMAARPFMRPARDAKRREVTALVKAAVNRALRSGFAKG
jgi:hypothetical protein